MYLDSEFWKGNQGEEQVNYFWVMAYIYKYKIEKNLQV